MSLCVHTTVQVGLYILVHNACMRASFHTQDLSLQNTHGLCVWFCTVCISVSHQHKKAHDWHARCPIIRHWLRGAATGTCASERPPRASADCDADFFSPNRFDIYRLEMYTETLEMYTETLEMYTETLEM